MPRSRRHRPHEHRHRPRRAATALAAALTLLAALATACASDPDLDPGPPAPAQVTSTAPVATPTAGDPVITVAPDAGVAANDPIVEAFQSYTSALTTALERPEDGLGVVTEMTIGSAQEFLRRQFEDFQTNEWRISGTPEWVILGIREVDADHRQLLSCEYSAGAYPVDANGVPVEPVETTWTADEHWFVKSGDGWLIEHLYEGNFSCENVG